MADKLAWLLIILVGGGLVVGLIGLLMPLILFAAGFFGIALLIMLFAKIVMG